MKKFHFFAGLPRSGSTLLASILNQNPDVYVTPTSPMLDLLIANQEAWHNNPAVKANPDRNQLNNTTRALIHSCWEHRHEPIIIDKCRGWMKNMPASTILFEEEIKVIATVRDLPSIMASWWTLLEKNPGSAFEQEVIQIFGYRTKELLLAYMFDRVVRDCLEGLQQLKQDAGNRLLLVEYDNLIDYPYTIISIIESFLDLPTYKYDFKNIINDTNDDDLLAWGFKGMHEIRPTIQKTSKSALEILGDELFEVYSENGKIYNV